jgi:hypothetical protein
MNRVTGTTPSSDTLKIYNQNRTTYAQKGSPTEINAAMWLSISTLAANVCQDLYNQERAIPDLASRAFFKDFSLQNGSTNNFEAVIGGKTAKVRMVERMARAFWGREATSAEVTAILNEMLIVNVTVAADGTRTETTVTNYTALSAAQAKQGIIIVCTAMLASLEAIQN